MYIIKLVPEKPFGWKYESSLTMVIKVKIGNLNSPRRNRPTCLENLSFYLTEYCENASIHGLKFLGERGRSIVEKIWWLVCLVTSLYFCIVLIMQIYHKWVNSPVIVTFATSQTPIWKIPFPSVSICPEIKSKRSDYNFTKELFWSIANNSDVDPERAARFGYMSLVCPTMLGQLTVSLSNRSEIVDETAVDFLMEVAPDIADIILSYKWIGKDLSDEDVELEKVFTPTVTSEGLCYTFNRLDRDEIFTNSMEFQNNGDFLINQNPSHWTVEKGYDENAELDTFPRRTILSGMKGGLELILATNVEDIDPLCADAVQGYKVILQHPAEIPKANEHYFRVPLNQDVVAAVKPNMMTTSEDLRYYDPEDRQCYFIEEKQLRFFKVYNQENCLLECLTNFTYNYCGCVGFFMPRDNSTEICGDGMMWCLPEANGLFLAQEVNVKLKSTKNQKRKLPPREKTDDENFNEVCNCLPSCNSLEFETETSQSDWDWRAALTLLNYSDIDESHYSRLRIFFKDMQFITSERNQLYGQTDFWANCGGLLGLFTGFSFISLMEILYFLTLRFICNVKKFGKNYWSGAKELMEAKDE